MVVHVSLERCQGPSFPFGILAIPHVYSAMLTSTFPRHNKSSPTWVLTFYLTDKLAMMMSTVASVSTQQLNVYSRSNIELVTNVGLICIPLHVPTSPRTHQSRLCSLPKLHLWPHDRHAPTFPWSVLSAEGKDPKSGGTTWKHILSMLTKQMLHSTSHVISYPKWKETTCISGGTRYFSH